MKNKTNLTVILLALGAFVTGTSEFVVSGILEIIASDLNVPIPLTGQLITIYSLSYAVGALVLVLLTARFDRKKVLLSSMLMFIAGNLIAFFSHTFILLMISRVVMAMSGGLYIVIATSYAARISEDAKKGSAIATVITGFTVSLVIGVPIGTLLSTVVDWHYIFLIIALFTTGIIFSLYTLLPEIDIQSVRPFKQQLQVIKDGRLIAGLLTTVLWILGYTMVFAYISPLLSASADLSTEMISGALFVLGIFAFLGSRFGGYAVDRWGPNRTIKISLVIHALSLFALTLTASSPIALTFTLIFWGASTWTTTPAKQFYLISLNTQSSETILSFNTALMNVGMMAGAGLGGLIIEYTSISNLSWIGGVFVLLALLSICYSFHLEKQIKEQNVGQVI